MSRVPVLKRTCPRDFPLFRVITRSKRPSQKELDAAILIAETMLTRLSNAHSLTSVWDVLSRLSLPPSQESWLRSLFMDVAGASPAPRDPRSREAEFTRYLRRVHSELRSIRRELSRRNIEPATTPFSALERLF